MKKKLFIMVPLAALLVYLAGFLYSRYRFLPHTFLAGRLLSGSDLEQQETIEAAPPTVTVLQKKSGSQPLREIINLKEDAGYVRQYDVKELLDTQNHFLWFVSLFADSELKGVLPLDSYDEEKLKERISQMYCLQPENTVMPQNARIAIADGQLVIEEADDGCAIDPETAYRLIREAVEKLPDGSRDITVDLTDSYLKAEIRSDNEELNRQLSLLQPVTAKTVSVNVSNGHSASVSGQELMKLLNVEDNQLTVNEAGLEELVSSICNANYISQYNYLNKDKLRNSLRDVLLGSENATVNAEWIKLKKKHIDVSLSRQLLSYYEDDVLIFTSPIVSGRNGDTPTGWFSVTDLSRNCTLRGAGYSNFVKYWIGWDRTGNIYGFHDASWRSEFGGEIYKTDPSHGCINMPTDKVERLYNSVSLGTTVYIHN